MRFVRWFSEIGLSDVGLVGGKNASLGEMIRFLAPLGVRVPDGFAITAEGYRHFLRTAGLERPIAELLSGIRRDDVKDLVERSNRIRALITGAELPEDLSTEALAAYRDLSARYSTDAADVAVRSSATAEDLPGASFAGQQDTFLNVRGERQSSMPCGAASRASSPLALSATARTWGSTIARWPCRWAYRRWCARIWQRRACYSPSNRKAATAGSSC